jgi:hypothetical protein
MRRGSQDEGKGKECHNNKKIMTTMTKRMKRGLQHEGNGK